MESVEVWISTIDDMGPGTISQWSVKNGSFQPLSALCQYPLFHPEQIVHPPAQFSLAPQPSPSDACEKHTSGYCLRPGKTPLGPWIKYEGNPILSRQHTGMNGTGHGDLFSDKRGRMLYVFHTHYSNDKVAPRRTAIIRFRFVKEKGASDRLMIDQKSFRFLQLDK